MKLFRKGKLKKDNSKIKYHNWNDITISVYDKIVTITENEDLCEAEKDIAVIAVLCDVDEQEIYDMEISDIQKLRNSIKFLNTFDFDKTRKHKSIQIGKTKCHIDYDLQHMTYAQYVDFQSYWSIKSFTHNLSKLLSVFIIPNGKKYNEDYDIVEFIKEIEDNVSIITANEICFFFLKRLVHSTKVMLTCLNLMTKMKKNIPTEKKQEIEKITKEMENQLLTLTTG